MSVTLSHNGTYHAPNMSGHLVNPSFILKGVYAEVITACLLEARNMAVHSFIVLTSLFRPLLIALAHPRQIMIKIWMVQKNNFALGRKALRINIRTTNKQWGSKIGLSQMLQERFAFVALMLLRFRQIIVFLASNVLEVNRRTMTKPW